MKWDNLAFQPLGAKEPGVSTIFPHEMKKRDSSPDDGDGCGLFFPLMVPRWVLTLLFVVFT